MVALQALAYYAAFSGANAIDLRLNLSSPTSSLVSLFSINTTTYRMYQSQEVINLWNPMIDTICVYLLIFYLMLYLLCLYQPGFSSYFYFIFSRLMLTKT